MVSLIWHRKALDDLSAIKQFISRDSPVYGKLVVQKIKEATIKLKKFPLIGRKVPEIDMEPIREIIVQKYRVIYQLNIDQVIIIAVLHSSQEFQI